ncbi:MAG: hypothetical protein IJL61_04165 [Bacteroidales bacterium]|nr:hypothetical protein [Bacteroidales bacterium]
MPAGFSLPAGRVFHLLDGVSAGWGLLGERSGPFLPPGWVPCGQGGIIYGGPCTPIALETRFAGKVPAIFFHLAHHPLHLMEKMAIFVMKPYIP